MQKAPISGSFLGLVLSVFAAGWKAQKLEATQADAFQASKPITVQIMPDLLRTAKCTDPKRQEKALDGQGCRCHADDANFKP